MNSKNAQTKSLAKPITGLCRWYALMYLQQIGLKIKRNGAHERQRIFFHMKMSECLLNAKDFTMMPIPFFCSIVERWTTAQKQEREIEAPHQCYDHCTFSLHCIRLIDLIAFCLWRLVCNLKKKNAREQLRFMLRKRGNYIIPVKIALFAMKQYKL